MALRLEESEVLVQVDCSRNAFVCPDCGQNCPTHDKRRRRWRHLDTCQLQTIVEADVPRVKCPEHGVRQVGVPWAEPGSKLTARLEALILKWLAYASIQAVADPFGLAWSTMQRVMERGVER